MNKKTHTEIFKQIIVELYKLGVPKSEIAYKYDISIVSINNWIKLYEQREIFIEDNINIEALLAIKKENKQLKQEVEILKKALNILL
ncbi:transposase [Orenia metallireducens]|uniref:Transposase n=1 Tax=Orenia metallireducens TaxID=1413210 RepID=A0A285ID72_9FIRM|nr:transposase [Orenia metallireducens]PRX21212.1 transposase [Orenia metallireducens]SNY44901.1 transposase [Orenia metallireducens]